MALLIDNDLQIQTICLRLAVSPDQNELLRSTQTVLTTISNTLANLNANGANVLKEAEKIIINPEFTKVKGSVENLLTANTRLQTPKIVYQDER